jgi:dTDP-4-dehydrorhamnose reductase
MRVLILGGSGMLGHKMYQKFKNRHDTFVTIRNYKQYRKYNLFQEDKVIEPFSVEDNKNIQNVMDKLHPDYVINCIGITKHQSISNNPIQMITVNSLFPHRLSLICDKIGVKLIHISTDCVFSGKKGGYKENDFADADDLYGRTKFLGEVKDIKNTLTIRTSIIGRELRTSFGLIEWFLSQNGGSVKGFKNAVFSGFTTSVLTDIITDILEKHSELYGLYHISAEPINKYELLNLVKEKFNLNIEIKPYDEFYCDRSLDSSKFRKKTGFISLSWEYMIDGLFAENRQYEEWRKQL